MSQPTDVAPRIAEELQLPLGFVRAALALLETGATVPFLARYRKEQTGGFDEVQLRLLDEKREYYAELLQRRATILAELTEQGVLTPELRARVEATWIKSVLEDLYLPYKPKRKTRAKLARDRGLLPLAQLILAQAVGTQPLQIAAGFARADGEVPDAHAALAGARDIVAELLADKSDLRAAAREHMRSTGVLTCTPVVSKTKVPTKFEMYYQFAELAARVPSHRYLAIKRGEEEGILRSHIAIDETVLAERAAQLGKVNRASTWAEELRTAAQDAVARLVVPSIETEVGAELKVRADLEAIRIFAENLRKVLLQPALGRKCVIGIDPGQRTGCKCVVVDDIGKLVEHTLINLVLGPAALAHAKTTLQALVAKHKPFAFAVGNGTHGRETADFCRSLGGDAIVVMVNESGASVYSASDVAREEFPDLDLTVRGAISIARRLQDPLAELVKLDPKVIGVGQYQHDVHQGQLLRKLGEVVESCVNAVGVELNTASADLLQFVAGVGAGLAKKIVRYRDANGAFVARKDLLKVPGLGPKAYEQCAGFIRVRGSTQPLDESAVHPERYALVAQMAKDLQAPVRELVGDAVRARQIDLGRYVSKEVGMPTLIDIQRELAQPGRDPRSEFVATAFRDDVREMADLKPGMHLEGVVTNVTAFGAFVDIGVHQDGLVHISQLSDRFVRDPHEVVKVGDTLKVHVVEVDLPRKRIALSAKAQMPVAVQICKPAAAVATPATPATPATSSSASFQNNPFAKLRKN